MILWKKEYIRGLHPVSYETQVRMLRGRCHVLRVETTDVIFKRHEAEWILPYGVGKHLKFNPRHLPVVQERTTNEDHYLRLSIRRLLRGYLCPSDGQQRSTTLPLQE